MTTILDWLQTQLGFSTVLMVVILNVMLGATAYCIYLERKVAAWLQDRHGPNRVGPYGLLQSIADGIKMLMKEDFIPAGADRKLFLLAPMLIFVVALIGFAVIPWGGEIRMPNGNIVQLQVASLNIGLLYILAVGSLGVYGIVLGGWSSNNKYSLYGGMRAAAQMLSYEIPLGLAILTVVVTCGEMRLESIVANQISPAGGWWYVLLHPLACVVMIIAAIAESNRAPFDLAECEQELVGGYHTEYSALKFGMFFLAEYAHMITASVFITVLFFGGWELFPFSWKLNWAWLAWYNTSVHWAAGLLRVSVVVGKIVLFIFLYMWIRWTLPRFRYDQLMTLAWKGLIPLALGSLALAVGLVYCGLGISIWAPVGNAGLFILMILWSSIARTEVTGRQTRLPPITANGGAPR